MGRLDDIIERNKNPKTSFRKPAKGSKRDEKPAEATPAEAAASEPTAATPDAPDAKPSRTAKSYSKVPAPPKSTTREVNQRVGDEKGRLDKIVARNRKPDANYRWLKVGLAGIVLFVVLILLLFTDLAAPPRAAYPEAPAAKPAGVDGVKLWRAPVKKAGSAAERPK